jgi:2-polyprenyl-3-methyl-5-hydroxy-6-metoxy-1,4-benzoquinol methylase
MVAEASRRHPDIEFRVGGPEALRSGDMFDVILVVDVIGHLLDVAAVLSGIRRFCTSSTRIVIAYYNFLWERAAGS